MIDCISGGRLIAGLVVGGGPEYYSNGVNPAEARGRFSEAVDLVLRCWTEPGPFVHMGRYYKLRYVNPWPTPIQKPHPPIWIPGAGSLETMEYVAKRRWSYMGIPYFHKRVFKRNFDFFRERARRKVTRRSPQQMGGSCRCTWRRATSRRVAKYEPHLWHFAHRLLPGINISPPGYTSPRSALKTLSAFGDFMLNVTTWDQIEGRRLRHRGQPCHRAPEARRDGVVARRGEFTRAAAARDAAGRAHAAEQELFAREVMPYLRDVGGRTGMAAQPAGAV
jgi:alkanesulfonate monooxygenase SsuD/methylene tetrahydromethanopterin reductase-like flavin-dependent oxidoreductase (luciferase family)